jgi:hypothetical protein
MGRKEPAAALSRFVDRETSADWMRAPQVLDAKWFATDGKIIGWHAADRMLGTSPLVPPSAVDGLRRFMAARDSQVVACSDVRGAIRRALADEKHQRKCNECSGCGRSTSEICAKCEGDGSCSHCDAECRTCDGAGFIHYAGGKDTCQGCDGHGRTFHGYLVLGGVAISCRYASLLVDLEADIGPAYLTSKTSRAFPFACVSDGIVVVGAVMEIHPYDDRTATRIEFPAEAGRG